MASESDHWLFETDLFDIDENENANLAIWPQLPAWTLHEATSLSYGFDPDFVAENFLPRSGTFFVREFRERMMLAERAVEAKKLKSPCSPSSYIKWAATVGIHINPDVSKAVQSAGTGLPVEDDNRPIHASLKRSLLKIILGVAVSKYQYRPSYNSAATLILNDLENLGLKLDVGTIRTQLGNAADLFYSDIEEYKAKFD